jgi:hypothetical protein
MTKPNPYVVGYERIRAEMRGEPPPRRSRPVQQTAPGPVSPSPFHPDPQAQPFLTRREQTVAGRLYGEPLPARLQERVDARRGDVSPLGGVARPANGERFDLGAHQAQPLKTVIHAAVQQTARQQPRKEQ